MDQPIHDAPAALPSLDASTSEARHQRKKRAGGGAPAPVKKSWLLLLAVLLAGGAVYQVSGQQPGVTYERILKAASRAAELADLRRHLHEPAVQRAQPDHAVQRRQPRIEVGRAEPGVRRLAIEPARRRRDDVRHAAAERRHGDRCQDRQDVLAVSLHAVAGRARLLRRQQPRRRDSRRHALPRHARRAPDRARRAQRQAALERRGRRRQARLLDHDDAAHRQGQGGRRRRRRRVRHPRVRRGLRREDRQGSLEVLHDSRSGRAGARLMAGRRVEDGRRIGVGDRFLRSGSEPDLLGHRQSRARTGIRISAAATTCTPIPSSRSTPTPAS